MRLAIYSLGAIIIMMGCLEEIEVKTEPVCFVVDTTRQENVACILGTDALCYCPSDDSGVQKRCDDGNLPFRAPSLPLCEAT